MDNRTYRPRKSIPKPRIKPTETDWAYLAGFLDGDGSIGASPPRARGGNAQITLSARQVNRGVLVWIQERFGGSIHIHKRGPNNFNPGATNFIWRVSSRQEVSHLIKGMLPYLVYKRPQAIIALRLTFPILPSLDAQRQLVQQIRALKRLRG